ncbi:hypothetical protein [Wielerella bovis]|uniref:hypothetical protein n=1 Tax=Wielerella bovis TaxID=2917790 RepID=UPI00201888A4|nr:hypothetical protein [Wielerella bovis]ULJ66678.1 hypothetical protein MIS31_10585 [Wielerella bovis]
MVRKFILRTTCFFWVFVGFVLVFRLPENRVIYCDWSSAMAVKDDEKNGVGFRLGNTPFESRTADYVNQTGREMQNQWRQGNHARAVGTGVRGVVGGIVSGAGETLGYPVKATLNHAVLPVFEKIGQGYDGVKDFGRGLFGIGDKQPETQSAQVGGLQGVSNQAQAKVEPVAAKGFGLVNRANLQSGNVMGNGAVSGQGQDAPREREQSFGLSVMSSGANGGLNAKMPDFNQSRGQPFVASFGADDDRERKRLMTAALTPHKGAQNGQLTANQLNMARGLHESVARNALDLQKSQEQLAAQSAASNANHVNALQREWLQQQGGLQRQALSDAAADVRSQAQLAQAQQQFEAKLGFDKARMQPEMVAQEQKNDLNERLRGLQERLIAAKDDETKSEIARQLGILSGQGEPKVGGFNKDAFMKLSRDVIGADGLPTQRDDIVDLRTGKSILQDDKSGIQVGMVQGGYRFKGGNPNDKKNWEKV